MKQLVILLYITQLFFVYGQEENTLTPPGPPTPPPPPVDQIESVPNCNVLEDNYSGTCEVNHYGTSIIAKQEVYENGRLIRRNLYRKTGHLMYEAEYGKEDDWTIRSIEYSEKYLVLLKLKNGTGSWERYLKDGSLLIRGKIKDHKLSGYWKRYTNRKVVDSVQVDDFNVGIENLHQLQLQLAKADSHLLKAYLKEENKKKNLPEIRYEEVGIAIPPPVSDLRVVQAEVIVFPDVEAEFPGGPQAMQKWIGEHIQYPEIALQNGEQGKVYLSFVVEPDGSLTNIKIERGISTSLDKEAKRLVRTMPKWIPGESNGKKTRTRVRIPIVFRLN